MWRTIMMKTIFKAAIFDLDGTLLDSIGDLSLSMNETLASYGLPKKTRLSF